MSFVAHSFALENQNADVSVSSSAPIVDHVNHFYDKEDKDFDKQEITAYDSDGMLIALSLIAP